ncbi:hypothetical protein EVA_06552 [gut metagenome]|uniref:Uncharacterized protein n=1 Tax=gut metagenome TaxID=749906 RepID=J9GX98_9ZZZZ
MFFKTVSHLSLITQTQPLPATAHQLSENKQKLQFSIHPSI